jgi:KUP system potassium uptake protein
MSAVEGLEVAAPRLATYVVPVSVMILVGLFALQRHGTGGVGRIFGPVMLLWFVTIGTLGACAVWRHPHVLAAVDPRLAVRFLIQNRLHGLLVLGAVFLSVTGAEALYADMGHFGRRPIRIACTALVLPALLLNWARSCSSAPTPPRIPSSTWDRPGSWRRWWGWPRWPPSSPRRR